MISKKENSRSNKNQASFSELRKMSSLGKLNLSQSFIQQQSSFSNLNLSSTMEVQNLANELENIVRRRSLTSRNSYESEKYFSNDSKNHPIFNCLKNESEQIQLKVKNRKWSENNQQKYKTSQVANSYLIKGAFDVIQESCQQQQEQDYYQDTKITGNKITANSKVKGKTQLQNSIKFQKQLDHDDKRIKSRGVISTQNSKNIRQTTKVSKKSALQELQKMSQQLDSKRLSRPSSNRIQNSSKTCTLIEQKTKIIPKYQKESPKITIVQSRQTQLCNPRMKTCGNQMLKQSTKKIFKKSSIIPANQVKSNEKQQVKELKPINIRQHENQQQIQIFQKIYLKPSKQKDLKNNLSNNSNFMKPTQMISDKQKEKLIQRLQNVKGQLVKNQVQIRSLQEINKLLDTLSSLIN